MGQTADRIMSLLHKGEFNLAYGTFGRHDRLKFARNTYLERGDRTVGLVYHATEVVTWLEDGSIVLHNDGWYTCTTSQRINWALRPKWGLWSERGNWILTCGWWNDSDKREYLFQGGITIHPDGSVSGAGDLEAARQEIRDRDNAVNRERSKLRYWTRKARNHDAGTLTLERVLQEPNVSVRVAKMCAYGIERFLLDAGAKVIDEERGYQLVQVVMANGGSGWTEQEVTALKMTCPSTGAVYVSPVAPHCDTVRRALDWMFQCEGYLDKVTQQS